MLYCIRNGSNIYVKMLSLMYNVRKYIQFLNLNDNSRVRQNCMKQCFQHVSVKTNMVPTQKNLEQEIRKLY